MDNLLSLLYTYFEGKRTTLAVDRRYVYVLKLNKKKSFFRPYANYFHGLSLLCMFAFTFRIREQEQILLNTI